MKVKVLQRMYLDGMTTVLAPGTVVELSGQISVAQLDRLIRAGWCSIVEDDPEPEITFVINGETDA